MCVFWVWRIACKRTVRSFLFAIQPNSTVGRYEWFLKFQTTKYWPKHFARFHRLISFNESLALALMNGLMSKVSIYCKPVSGRHCASSSANPMRAAGYLPRLIARTSFWSKINGQIYISTQQNSSGYKLAEF